MSGINKLDIKQLRVLQLLLQERNLSRVANIMGLSQQAISDQLKKLRNSFDDPLFIRVSNGVVPTSMAESLEVRVSEIINNINNLFSEGAIEPSMFSGVFCISASDYALVTILPKLIKKINRIAPNLKVIIRDFESDKLEQLMVTGEIDLAISFPEFISDSCRSELLFQEQHVCVVSNKSSIAGSKMTIAELALHPQLIISPSRANLRGSHDKWFKDKGLTRNVTMSIPSFSAAPSLIYQTNVACFLPSRLLPNNKLATIELDELPPCFDVIAAWHNRTSNNPVLQWILTIVKQTFDEG